MWKIRSSTANARLATARKTKTNPFSPGLLSFGPMCLFNGFRRAYEEPRGWHDPYTFTWAAIGIALLMIGLLMLLADQQRLERRLDEMERLKN